MKLYLLLFFISAQITIASILENDFIIISGMQGDLDERENLQTTLDNIQNNATENNDPPKGVGACTSFLIDSLHQTYPTNIIVTENILMNLISHAQMFKKFLNQELQKSNSEIYAKLIKALPSIEFCQFVDSIIEQEIALGKDEVNFESTQYSNFINEKLIKDPVFYSNFMQNTNKVTYYEALLYRAPLNKYEIIELANPEDKNGAVYWLKPKTTLDTELNKDPILIALENKSLTPKYIDIKCNSSDSLTQIILEKKIINKKSSIVLNGHGSQNLGGVVAGIKDIQLQKILDNFATIPINVLFIISCYATKLVHLSELFTNKKFTFARPIVIQGEAENPDILNIPAPSISTEIGKSTTWKETKYPDGTIVKHDEKTLFTLKISSKPTTFYNFDVFFNHVKSFSTTQFLKINYKEQFDTLIINPTYKASLQKDNPGILFPIYVKVPIPVEQENYNDLVSLTVILAILKK